MRILSLSLVCLFLLCVVSPAHAEVPFMFAQIIDTPDQVIGAKILKVAYGGLGIPIKIIQLPGR